MDADTRFTLHPHEKEFISQVRAEITYRPSLFTICLHDPQQGSFKARVMALNYSEYMFANLLRHLEEECKTNFDDIFGKGLAQLKRIQQYNTKCACFVDVPPEQVKHTHAPNTELGYVRCFRVEYEKKPDSALWEFHYRSIAENTIKVKRHVVKNIRGKSHRDVVGKLLAEASWNKPAKLWVCSVAITYFDSIFKQQVDMPGVDVAVVPGRIYQVMQHI